MEEVKENKIYYLKNQTIDNKLEWIQGLNKSGYAGITSEGMLVDRREFPNAIAIQNNTMFKVIEPKKLDNKYKKTLFEKAMEDNIKQNKEKYYIPTTEEFYIGFEYEVLNLESDIQACIFLYDKEIFCNKSNLEDLSRAIQYNKIKVKYLDKEDIEGLGFIQSTTNNFFELRGNTREYYLSINYYKENKGYYLSIGENKSQFGFSGYIKNKSELKILLKQLGI